MKSTVEQLNSVQCRVNVEISAQEVNAAFENAFRKLQKKARVQGFRPGKAPINVLRKIYGANVSSEVHESLINQHLFAALNEQTIRPIASPVVETKAVPAQDAEFSFSAVVDVMPKIEIDGYKGVEVTVEKYAVKDETMQREIDALRRRQARTREVEAGAKAAAGMLATVNHSASLDGVDQPSLRVDDMNVALGQNELYEGLENEILGMGVGETKAARIALPETYGDPELAGKTLDFSITVTALKHLEMPELDDELAKDLEFGSKDELLSRVKEHMQNRADELSRQRLETAILDKLVEANPFEVPPAMVDQVIDSMIDELPHRSQEERQAALRNDEMRKGFRDTAKRRTQNTLVLWHVTQRENLQVTDDEVRERLEETLAGAGVQDPKQAARLRKNLELRIRENMIFEKAMNFLIDHAQRNEVVAQI
jgi:trigger factor